MTLPGYCWAEEEKRTHRPVSKFADRHVELARQRSMQSVSIRVPGLESRMSSGAVNTLPVTSSVCVESPGAEQNWVRAGERRAESSTGGRCYQACHHIIVQVVPWYLLIHTRGVKQEVSFIKCLITSSFLSSVKMGWSSAFCQVSLFITSTSNIILFLFTGFTSRMKVLFNLIKKEIDLFFSVLCGSNLFTTLTTLNPVYPGGDILKICPHIKYQMILINP